VRADDLTLSPALLDHPLIPAFPAKGKLGRPVSATVRVRFVYMRPEETRWEFPVATPRFAQRSWRVFQRAIDPLGRPRPLPQQRRPRRLWPWPKQ